MGYQSGFANFVRAFREEYSAVEKALIEEATTAIKNLGFRQRQEIGQEVVRAMATLTLDNVLDHTDFNGDRINSDLNQNLKSAVIDAARKHAIDYLQHRGPVEGVEQDFRVLQERSQIWFGSVYSMEKGIGTLHSTGDGSNIEPVYVANARKMTGRELREFQTLTVVADYMNSMGKPGKKPRKLIGPGDRFPRRAVNPRRLRQKSS